MLQIASFREEGRAGERRKGRGPKQKKTSPPEASFVGGATAREEENAGGWEVVKNLRVGRTNLTYCSVDVQWNPSSQLEHLVATAATNGAIAVWNVNTEAKKQERVIKEHNRTVNRISWNPHDCNVLLSASQDGTVKRFDLRDSSKAGQMCYQNAKCEVRDVQYHPFYENYFAAAYDNGSIQLWDARSPGKESLQQITAGHQGLVLAIAWHPQQRSVIASAGRDRLVKVWDLKKERPHDAVKVIQTIASVGRIQWRPKFPNQIASAHSVMDSSVHIWDVQRPFLPLYSFPDHTDVVTGFLFDKRDDSRQTVLSCSKDGTLRSFRIREDAVRHYDHVPGSAISWSPSNDFVYVSQTIIRAQGNNSCDGSHGSGGSGQKRTPRSGSTSTSEGEDQRSLEFEDSSRGSSQEYLQTSATQLAQEDRARSQSAGVRGGYEEMGRQRAETSGGERYGREGKRGSVRDGREGRKGSSAPVEEEAAGHDGGERNDVESRHTTAEDCDDRHTGSRSAKDRKTHRSHGSHEILPSVPHAGPPQPLKMIDGSPLGAFDFCKRTFLALAKSYVFTGITMEAMCIHNEMAAHTQERVDLVELWQMLRLLYCGKQAQCSASATKKKKNLPSANSGSNELQIFSDPLMLFSRAQEASAPLASSPQSVTDYLFLDSAHLNQEPFQPLVEDFSVDFTVDTDSFVTAAPTFANGSNSQGSDWITSTRGATSGASALTVPEFVFTESLRGLLVDYAEAGDVQTCVAVMRVCAVGGVFPPATTSPSGSCPWTKQQEQQWLFSYVDLLSQFQLWTQATEVIKHCGEPSLGALNKTATRLYPSCGGCKKPLQPGGACPKCKTRASCSVCRQPMRGLVSWCQGCGHGGHTLCLKKWFKADHRCPAACKHSCTYH